jgi:hypothetical protein
MQTSSTLSGSQALARLGFKSAKEPAKRLRALGVPFQTERRGSKRFLIVDAADVAATLFKNPLSLRRARYWSELRTAQRKPAAKPAPSAAAAPRAKPAPAASSPPPAVQPELFGASQAEQFGASLRQPRDQFVALIAAVARVEHRLGMLSQPSPAGASIARNVDSVASAMLASAQAIRGIEESLTRLSDAVDAICSDLNIPRKSPASLRLVAGE